MVCLVCYLEGEDQVTELEHGLQIQPEADLMNSCRQHSSRYTGELAIITVIIDVQSITMFLHFTEFTVNTVTKPLALLTSNSSYANL